MPSAQVLRILDNARISFVRGDTKAALASTDEALEGMESCDPSYRDVIAFRLFLESMISVDSERGIAELGEESTEKCDALGVVSLCIESDKQWHSGGLMRGLSLNRSAIENSHDVAPMWRVYADMLLAKKLSDIHISLQANRVIRDMESLIDRSGLLVFGSLSEALRSVLHLQAGHFEKATDSAATAVRISVEQASAVGVKLALSVEAIAHLGRGEWDRASEALKSFHAKTNYYALPDSVARAAFAEIALVAASEGPRAATEQIHAKWHLLSTDSACFIEDPARPTWLISVARRAGDIALAQRCLRAIERLANRNPGFTLLDSAAESARTALTGEKPELSSILDFGAGRQRNAASPGASSQTPASEAQRRDRPAPRSPQPIDAVSAAPHESSRMASLSIREIEIARLVSRGMTNQQVAKQLELSPHTVNFHLRNIYRKLSISTRVKLGPIIAQSERGQRGS
ncbi:helix-turn-helix transcriptional regulator [Streptomyces sp. A5-4]|uniref:helix-turn-helix transcriptional regulator n=1 Tax=Streptomyces sp. A5-4 TaxID=3384771 RepID=UPI003DA85519